MARQRRRTPVDVDPNTGHALDEPPANDSTGDGAPAGGAPDLAAPAA